MPSDLSHFLTGLVSLDLDKLSKMLLVVILLGGVLTVQVSECCKQWSCIGELLLVCWLGVQVTELFVGRPPLHVICRATTTPWASDWKCFQVHSSASCNRLLQTRPANENWDAMQGEPKYLVTEDKMSFTVSSSVLAAVFKPAVLSSQCWHHPVLTNECLHCSSVCRIGSRSSNEIPLAHF